MPGGTPPAGALACRATPSRESTRAMPSLRAAIGTRAPGGGNGCSRGPGRRSLPRNRSTSSPHGLPVPRALAAESPFSTNSTRPAAGRLTTSQPAACWPISVRRYSPSTVWRVASTPDALSAGERRGGLDRRDDADEWDGKSRAEGGEGDHGDRVAGNDDQPRMLPRDEPPVTETAATIAGGLLAVGEVLPVGDVHEALAGEVPSGVREVRQAADARIEERDGLRSHFRRACRASVLPAPPHPAGRASSRRESMSEGEKSAEVRPVLVLDQLVDRFRAVPVRAGAVEPAVQADLEILAARGTGRGAIDLTGVLDGCQSARVMTQNTPILPGRQ